MHPLQERVLVFPESKDTRNEGTVSPMPEVGEGDTKDKEKGVKP
jgi:hypothetical protein